MNIVKLDCDDTLERFKEGCRDLLANHSNIKDFITILIDKDNGVQVRKSKSVLPLITTMQYLINGLLNDEITISNYSFNDGKFIPIEEDE